MGISNIFTIQDDIDFEESIKSFLKGIGAEDKFDELFLELKDRDDRWGWLRILMKIGTGIDTVSNSHGGS